MDKKIKSTGRKTSVYFNNVTMGELDSICEYHNVNSGSKMIVRLINDEFNKVRQKKDFNELVTTKIER